MKFVSKVNFLIILISVITAVSISTFSYKYQRNYLKKEVMHQLKETARLSMLDINHLLYQYAVYVKIMAQDPILKLARMPDYEITSKRLIEFQNTYKVFTNITIYSIDGQKLYGVTGVGPGIEQNQINLWANRLAQEDVLFDVIKFSDLRRTVIYFIAEIKNIDGRPLGVLVANSPIELIFDVIKDNVLFLHNDRLKIDLVDEKGSLIYTNHDSHNIARYFSSEDVVINENPNDFVVVTKQPPLEDFHSLNWSLILQLPKEMAFPATEQLLWELMVLIIPLIFLSVLIGMAFSRIISLPIDYLRKVVDEVKKGNLNVEIPVISHDEIGDLAKSFKEMTVTLKKTMNDLEGSVVQHQKDLQALYTNQQQLKAIMDNSTLVIYAKDLEGRYLFINRQYEKIFKTTTQEISGKTDFDFFPTHYAEQFRKNDLQVQNSKMVLRSEETVNQDDGVHTYISIKFPLFDAKNRVYAVCGFSADITDRKKTEETLSRQKNDLEKVNKELDNFVYMVSHDLRAPLRAIGAFSEYLEKLYAKKMDKEGIGFLKEIQKAARLMSQIIEDLLELSRIGRINNPYQLTPTSKIVNTALERFTHDINLHKTKMTVCPYLPEIECDPIKMEQVFANLFSNAIKFSSKTTQDLPQVEVGCLEKEDVYEFFVKDNGIGIELQDQKRIFQLFERVHPLDQYEGTGVGLAIVKRVVEEHGGRVWIESQVGKGATFYFTIPRNLTELNLEEDISI